MAAFAAMWYRRSGNSAFSGDRFQRREIDHAGAAFDHLFDLLPFGEPGNQLRELPVQKIAHRGEFDGQMVVLMEAAPAGQETVKVWVGSSQELDHVEDKQPVRREFAADQTVQVIRFQPIGGEVPNPFLAVKTVRRINVGAGNCESYFLFGHWRPRQNVVHHDNGKSMVVQQLVTA